MFNATIGGDDSERVFGQESKRRRLEDQRKGEFIVDAKQAVNFRLTSDLNALEDDKITS